MAAGAAGLLLAGGVAAAAVDSPEQATDGLSTAVEHSGVAVPVGADGDHPTPADHPTDDDQGVEPETTGAPEANHGAEVSAVATSDATQGVEHGEAVSEVARDGHGEDADEGSEDAEDSGEDADEVGEGNRAEQAELGADNAGEHGQP